MRVSERGRLCPTPPSSTPVPVCLCVRVSPLPALATLTYKAPDLERDLGQGASHLYFPGSGNKSVCGNAYSRLDCCCSVLLVLAKSLERRFSSTFTSTHTQARTYTHTGTPHPLIPRAVMREKEKHINSLLFYTKGVKMADYDEMLMR